MFYIIINIFFWIEIKNNGSIYVDLPGGYASHHFCFICKRESRDKNRLTRIPEKTINTIFIETKILIPFGARSCTSHLDEFGNLHKAEMLNIPIVQENIKLNSDSVKKIFNSYY